MKLLQQILIAIITILPLPLFFCMTGGHVGMFFMLISQPIVACIALTIYFCYTANIFGISKKAAVARAFVSSLIFAFASIIEWEYASALATTVDWIFGKDNFSGNSHTFFLILILIYASLSIACSVAITYWMFRPSSEEQQ